SRQAGDEPTAQRVTGRHHDNGDRCGGPLGRERPERSNCHDDIDVEANQLCCEFRQPFEPILRKAALERDVFPLDQSQLAQAIEKKRGKDIRYTWAEIADLVYLPSLLRACRERPRGCRAAEQRDELAALHSITSSASNCIEIGISRPSALALLAFITSANLVA